MCLLPHQVFRCHRTFQHFCCMTSFKPINIVFEVGKYHSWPNTLPFRVGYWGANTRSPVSDPNTRSSPQIIDWLKDGDVGPERNMPMPLIRLQALPLIIFSPSKLSFSPAAKTMNITQTKYRKNDIFRLTFLLAKSYRVEANMAMMNLKATFVNAWNLCSEWEPIKCTQ